VLSCLDYPPLVVDNIKDSFIVYFWERLVENTYHFNKIPFCSRTSKKYHLTLKPQYQIDFVQQINRLGTLKIKCNDLIEHMNTMIIKHYIPVKYAPTVNYINFPLKRISYNRRIVSNKIYLYAGDYNLVKVGYLSFPQQVISYIEQKYDDYKSKQLVMFFKMLNEHDSGLTFDEYISRWAKRLLYEQEQIYN